MGLHHRMAWQTENKHARMQQLRAIVRVKQPAQTGVGECGDGLLSCRLKHIFVKKQETNNPFKRINNGVELSFHLNMYEIRYKQQIFRPSRPTDMRWRLVGKCG